MCKVLVFDLLALAVLKDLDDLEKVFVKDELATPWIPVNTCHLVKFDNL